MFESIECSKCTEIAIYENVQKSTKMYKNSQIFAIKFDLKN